MTSKQQVQSSKLQANSLGKSNENPQFREESVNIIREWIKQQPHLKSRTDDVFILRLLRSCNFNLTQTKEKIDAYLTMKTALPEWFTNLDPLHPQIQELLDSGYYIVLPGYDKLGRRVMILRLGHFNPQKVNMNNMQKYDKMVASYLAEDEQTQINGLNLLADVSGYTAAHLSSFTPTVVKKFCMWLDVNPLNLAVINICKEPSIFQSLLSVFKLFLSEDLKQMIQLYGQNWKKLYEIIPQEILPVEYGGTAAKIQDMKNDLKAEILVRREQFLNDEKYGVDESKRPGKPKTKEDLFGTDGSFRKLSID